MRSVSYTYWQDGPFCIGFIDACPDYRTQGAAKDELVEQLKGMLADLESGDVPYVRTVDQSVPRHAQIGDHQEKTWKNMLSLVIPAKAGIQRLRARQDASRWVPAFAGTAGF